MVGLLKLQATWSTVLDALAVTLAASIILYVLVFLQ